MNPKVSVIVPVYNTEKYLEKCLDSLVNQTLTDIEIICVNDGSTDGSLAILNKFAADDFRIKVINQNNKGQSAARNAGLSAAKGEYIGFLDSDDFADNSMFEKLYYSAKKNDSDLIMCAVNLYNDKTSQVSSDDPYFGLKIFEQQTNSDMFFDNVFSYEQCKDFLFRICVVPWNKLIKANFLKENNIKFVEGLSFEDNIFCLELLLKAKRISLFKDALPFYRISTQHSLTYGVNDEVKLDVFKIFDYMQSVLEQNNAYTAFKDYFLLHKKNTLLYWYKKINNEKVKDLYKKRLKNLYSDIIL